MTLVVSQQPNQPRTLGILMNSNTLLGFVILSTILRKSFIMDVLQKQGDVQWKWKYKWRAYQSLKHS
jgi:hypothetical protein